MPTDPFPPDDAARRPGDENVVDPAVLAERRAQRAEVAERVAARRAADAQALAAELSAERARLEAELAQARQEPERLARLVAERERAAQEAERRAAAEEARRIELAERLAAQEREHAAQLDELRRRLRDGSRAEQELTELRARVEQLRRRVDDAERAAEEAVRARRKAERKRAAARDKRRRAVAAATAAEAAREEACAERDALRAALRAVQDERDAARAELAAVRRERDAVRAELAAVRDAAGSQRAAEPGENAVARPGSTAVPAERDAGTARIPRARSGAIGAATTPLGRAPGGAVRRPPAAALRAELAVARTVRVPAVDGRRGDRAATSAAPGPSGRAADRAGTSVVAAALERERRMTAAAGGADTQHAAAPSGTLAAQLARSRERERALRDRIAELEREVAARVAAERRIEAVLRRVRGDLEAANALRTIAERRAEAARGTASRPTAGPTGADGVPGGPPTPSSPAAAPSPPVVGATTDAPVAPVRALDFSRLNAARERLRAATPADPASADAGPSGRAGPSVPAGAPASVRPAPSAPGGSVDAEAPSTPAGTIAPARPAPAAGAGPADAEAPPVPAAAPAPTHRVEPVAASTRTAGADAARATTAGSDAAPATTATTAAATAPGGTAPASPTRRPAPAPARVVGPGRPWLADAVRALLREDADAAGRALVALLPVLPAVARRELTYDVVIRDHGAIAGAVRGEGSSVRPLAAPRPRAEADLRISATHAGLARLLCGRRRRLRRGVRVRGSRRALRELRRLANEPLTIADLAAAGVAPDPTLAFRLVAHAIDPAATIGHAFTVAHAPMPGGPADAWLRVEDGRGARVLLAPPGEPPAVTLRTTRGGLFALLADVPPAPGEAAAADGDAAALALLRGWLDRTPHRGR